MVPLFLKQGQFQCIEMFLNLRKSLIHIISITFYLLCTSLNKYLNILFQVSSTCLEIFNLFGKMEVIVNYLKIFLVTKVILSEQSKY